MNNIQRVQNLLWDIKELPITYVNEMKDKRQRQVTYWNEPLGLRNFHAYFSTLFGSSPARKFQCLFTFYKWHVHWINRVVHCLSSHSAQEKVNDHRYQLGLCYSIFQGFCITLPGLLYNLMNNKPPGINPLTGWQNKTCFQPTFFFFS